MPLKYAVKDGDSIDSIAYENGFFPETIWNDNSNSDLKSKRKDPDILFPGDIVTIPDKRIKEENIEAGKRNTFKKKSVPKKIKIRFINGDKPNAGMSYKLEVKDKLYSGKTDSDGWLSQNIMPDIKSAKIILEDGTLYELNFGHLNPIDEISGIQQRLKNLGYYESPVDGILNDETVIALKSFQNFNGLKITGRIDDDTVNKLKEASGC